MRWLAGLGFVAVLAGALAIGSQASTTVHACSCAGITDDEAYEMADVVFVGRLDQTRVSDEIEFGSTSPARFIFATDSVFKGEAYDRQSVVTAGSGASCGLEIRPGTTTLVFAKIGGRSGLVEGELTSDLCTGTRAVDDGAVPASFGDASPPLPGASGIGDGSPLVPTAGDLVRGAIVTSIVVAVAALAVLGLVRSRRTRRAAPHV